MSLLDLALITLWFVDLWTVELVLITTLAWQALVSITAFALLRLDNVKVFALQTSGSWAGLFDRRDLTTASVELTSLSEAWLGSVLPGFAKGSMVVELIETVLTVSDHGSGGHCGGGWLLGGYGWAALVLWALASDQRNLFWISAWAFRAWRFAGIHWALVFGYGFQCLESEALWTGWWLSWEACGALATAYVDILDESFATSARLNLNRWTGLVHYFPLEWTTVF